MKTIKALKERVGDLLNEVDAINAIATDEERELTTEDNARIDGIFAEIGEDGEKPSGIYAEIARAEKLEAYKARAAKTDPVPTFAKKDAKVFALPKKIGGLKSFKSEQEAYDCGMWIKAALLNDKSAEQHCMDKGLIKAAIHVEGTDSLGGYTVPSPLSSAILDVWDLYGVARQLANVIPMTSDSLDIPKRTDGLTVVYPGEATAITTSDKEWGTVALAAVKRAIMTQASNELIADSIISVVDDLVQEVGRAFGAREDVEFIQGDGSAGFGTISGLEDALGAGGKVTLGSGDTVFSDIVLADITALQALLPEKYHPNARFLMRRDCYAYIQGLLYAQGGTSANDVVAGTGPGLFGYPVVFSDAMPAEAVSQPAMFFGDFRNSAIIGARSDVSVSSSQDYAFNLDVLTIRALTRYDHNVWNPGTGSVPGGYVGMILAAS